uniref:UDP-glycosyltransferases domain-containing protein n=1 Tax=Bionectria ochroleuca TaxID=29856 RepID=A0A8H7N409_BIOOC
MVKFLSSEKPTWPPYTQGSNKIVLFLTNKEHGLSNVHVATASALLGNYPDIDVHYASFAELRSKIERVSSFARSKAPTARDIVFHELKGESFEKAVVAEGLTLDSMIHPPGYAGISGLTKDVQLFISPWTVEAHLELYHEIGELIDQLDPAVIVLDTLFRPAIDITRDKNRVHAMVTPNTLVDNFLSHQPNGSMFWKYPALSSGFTFPVPLRKIPENIYLNFRFIYSAMMTPDLSAKKTELKKHGLRDPINFLALHRPDVPWITMTTKGASIPVDYVPPNVFCAGPMYLSVATAAEQDAELADWLKNAPTVLLNLGSTVQYTSERAAVMVTAIENVLSNTSVQILWKFAKVGEYSDEVLEPLQQFVAGGRLRIDKWLTVDPTSLLETGDIVASVHHGGSNCYHEAIATGVPQVILPLWSDLYNFAALSETIGVGVWACRDTSPDWTAKGIRDAILKVVDGGETSILMKQKAKELGDRIMAGDRGRDISARVIAKLAHVE